MARAFHLLTYANKACPDTEASYFMSINTWGIKYIVTSSFNLILNSQKKKKTLHTLLHLPTCPTLFLQPLRRFYYPSPCL